MYLLAHAKVHVMPPPCQPNSSYRASEIYEAGWEALLLWMKLLAGNAGDARLIAMFTPATHL